ncbi:MAG TPA: outer membrane protein assembly factor BamD [Steroidobacteraceae bacterium]|nr:outer membrane protein assembly factor BamD [Steroidobacteraceae bacterium]
MTLLSIRSIRFPFLLPSLFAVLALAGCGHTRNKEMQGDPEVLYQKGAKALSDNDFGGAIKIYEALDSRYPFSDAARQGRLDLMYAYYKDHQAESAIDAADQFIRENPAHPRCDYANYIKGLVYFERTPNFLERWLRVDLSERPPSDARKSFAAFQTVVTSYPQSEYAGDAHERLLYLRNRLADYEVHVADYYMRRGAYLAAIARAKYTVENYDGAPAVKSALEIMTDGYRKLGMDDLAEQSASVYRENFPETAQRVDKKKKWWAVW